MYFKELTFLCLVMKGSLGLTSSINVFCCAAAKNLLVTELRSKKGGGKLDFSDITADQIKIYVNISIISLR